MSGPAKSALSLHPDDLADLRRSGLSDETIAAMGCRSADAEAIRAATGIVSAARAGYSIPYPGVADQTAAPYRRWRLRDPGDGPRYVAGLGDDPQLYVPPAFSGLPPNGDLLVVTEGEKKAAKCAQEGIPCVGLQGVWSWPAPGARAAERVEGEGVSDETFPLAGLLDLAREHERVLVLGDSDLTRKPQAAKGFRLLAQALLNNGVRAAFACCPPAIEGEGEAARARKQGVDDWLVADRDRARSSLSALFLAAELSAAPMTDTHNGREIARLFRHRLAFSRGVWWQWDKEAVVWAETNGRALAGEVGSRYRAEAAKLDDLARRVKSAVGPEPAEALKSEVSSWLPNIEAAAKDLRRAARAIENVRGFESGLKMAEHLLTVAGGEWDAAEHLLAVPNGVVDLRTSELLAPSPEHRATKIAGAAYDPAAVAPEFEKFLARVQPDPAVRDLLQRLAGYCATGAAREQRLFSLVGAGANGKGTFVDALAAALGTYGAKGTCDMLAQHPVGSPRFDLAAVAGARMVSISESSENLKLDENMLKSVTGGDLQTCRYPYGRFFSFKPCFTILVDTNHALQPHETGEAMWRRLVAIPWPVTIPAGERDSRLGDKLKKELGGILAWVVAGAKLYLESGLPEVEAVVSATRELRAASDDLGPWIEENCELVPEARIQSRNLYVDYKSWSEREGRAYTMGDRTFKKRLTEKGFKSRVSTGGRVFWFGVRLRERDTFLDAADAADAPNFAEPAGPPVAATTPPPVEDALSEAAPPRMPGGSYVV